MSKKAGDDAVSCCKASVVKLTPKCAQCCLIVNCICPGFGTMLSACCNGNKFECMTLVNGWAQGATAGLLIGWIWSIMHGLWLVKAAKGESY